MLCCYCPGLDWRGGRDGSHMGEACGRWAGEEGGSVPQKATESPGWAQRLPGPRSVPTPPTLTEPPFHFGSPWAGLLPEDQLRLPPGAHSEVNRGRHMAPLPTPGWKTPQPPLWSRRQLALSPPAPSQPRLHSVPQSPHSLPLHIPTTPHSRGYPLGAARKTTPQLLPGAPSTEVSPHRATTPALLEVKAQGLGGAGGRAEPVPYSGEAETWRELRGNDSPAPGSPVTWWSAVLRS